MAKKEKKKREKTVWVDDGRTIADMSGVQRRGFGPSLSDANPKRQSATEKSYYSDRPKWKDCLATYFAAVKMMFIPMLVVIAGICLIFLTLYLLSLAA
ncbi:MAG: hypothetical protein ACI3XI_08275 [Eubacteriales bacterium]